MSTCDVITHFVLATTLSETNDLLIGLLYSVFTPHSMTEPAPKSAILKGQILS